jgi:ankyrin repeat protein
LADYLIDYGYNIDYSSTDFEQKTPLILAAKIMSTRLVEKIISKVDARNINLQDKDGMTALHYACALGQCEMVKILRAAGADESICDNKGRKPIDHTIFDPNAINDILRSIFIDPNRDVVANGSVLSKNKQSNPLVLPSDIRNDFTFVYTNIPHAAEGIDDVQNHFILCSTKNLAPLQSVIKVLKFSDADETDETYFKDINYSLNVLKQLKGQSIAQACLAGRAQVAGFLKSQNTQKPLITTSDIFTNPSEEPGKRRRMNMMEPPSQQPAVKLSWPPLDIRNKRSFG